MKDSQRKAIFAKIGIAKSLIENGFVEHRVNPKTKQEQVRLTPIGKEARNLLNRLTDEHLTENR